MLKFILFVILGMPTALIVGHLIWFAIKHHFKDGIYHGVLTTQATWELHQLRLEAQKRRIEKRDTELIHLAEVEEVGEDEIPGDWVRAWHVQSSNGQYYTKEIVRT